MQRARAVRREQGRGRLRDRASVKKKVDFNLRWACAMFQAGARDTGETQTALRRAVKRELCSGYSNATGWVPWCVCAGDAVCLEADKTSVRQRMSLSLRMNNS